jgi:hypothetical protein
MPLPPGAAVAWPSVLMANDDDSNARLKAPIYDGVREDAQRKYPAALRGWCAEARMRGQEIGNALELVEESLCHQQAGLFSIEIQSVGDVLLRARMK